MHGADPRSAMQVHVGAERRIQGLLICRGLSFTSQIFLASEIRTKETLDRNDGACDGGALGHPKPVFEVIALLQRCTELIHRVSDEQVMR